jgi:tRNA-specific adenosine deaminase 1
MEPMSDSASGPSLPSRIASLVHAHFDALPTRSKPTVFPDGSREWVPMTGIVVVKGKSGLFACLIDNYLICA